MRSFSAGHVVVSYWSAGFTSVRPSFDSSSAWNAGSTTARLMKPPSAQAYTS